MAVHTIEVGYSVEDIRSKIVNALHGNHISSRKLDELFSIFFEDADVWARKEHLITRVTTTYDHIRLEEAARIVVDPMIYYDVSDGHYHIFGA